MTLVYFLLSKENWRFNGKREKDSFFFPESMQHCFTDLSPHKWFCFRNFKPGVSISVPAGAEDWLCTGRFCGSLPFGIIASFAFLFSPFLPLTSSWLCTPLAHPPSLMPAIVHTMALPRMFLYWNNDYVVCSKSCSCYCDSIISWCHIPGWPSMTLGKMPRLPLHPVCFGVSHSLGAWEESQAYIEPCYFPTTLGTPQVIHVHGLFLVHWSWPPRTAFKQHFFMWSFPTSQGQGLNPAFHRCKVCAILLSHVAGPFAIVLIFCVYW